MMWTSGLLHTGDTLAYVYTQTAEGTTHGFERGYDAFLGDPFRCRRRKQQSGCYTPC